jgi:hypothetical protein
VLCQVTPRGVRLIAELDAPMDAANQRAASMLERGEQQQVVELLGAIRAAYGGARDAERRADRGTERAQGSARAGQPAR